MCLKNYTNNSRLTCYKQPATLNTQLEYTLCTVLVYQGQEISPFSSVGTCIADELPSSYLTNTPTVPQYGYN